MFSLIFLSVCSPVTKIGQSKNSVAISEIFSVSKGRDSVINKSFKLLLSLFIASNLITTVSSDLLKAALANGEKNSLTAFFEIIFTPPKCTFRAAK